MYFFIYTKRNTGRITQKLMSLVILVCVWKRIGKRAECDEVRSGVGEGYFSKDACLWSCDIWKYAV